MDAAFSFGEKSLDGYRMPAEWEPQDALWLAWPANEETWPENMERARLAYARIIETVAPHQKVYLLTGPCGADEAVRSFLEKENVPLENVQFCNIPYNDSWMRDAGPLFVVNAEAEEPLVGHNFIFNAWGNKYEPWADDNAIPQHVTRLLQVPCVNNDFVLEGGSLDVNGQGTLLTTRQCLLNKNRNPQFSMEAIESRLRQSLGVSRILWLGEGIEGDDTDGHIDDITRFVGPHRVLTVLENQKNDPNYEPLHANWQELKKMGDQDGNRLEVVDIPMPDRELSGPFGRSPASYANFLITNRTVLVPVFNAPNESSVLSVFSDLFPDREIVPIDCEGLVQGLGAIHCISQQQPQVA